MKIKAFLLFSLFLFLAACEEPTYTGGGVLNSQAVSVGVQGVSKDGFTIESQQVSINGEVIANVVRKPGPGFSILKDHNEVYEPAQTKYGLLELRAKYPQNGTATYEVYIDGKLVAVVPIPTQPTYIFV